MIRKSTKIYYKKSDSRGRKIRACRGNALLEKNGLVEQQHYAGNSGVTFLINV